LIRDFPPGPPENVLSAARRYLAGMLRFAAARPLTPLLRLRRGAQPRQVLLKLFQACIAAHWATGIPCLSHRPLAFACWRLMRARWVRF
jgi:hypothetical protein